MTNGVFPFGLLERSFKSLALEVVTRTGKKMLPPLELGGKQVRLGGSFALLISTVNVKLDWHALIGRKEMQSVSDHCLSGRSPNSFAPRKAGFLWGQTLEGGSPGRDPNGVILPSPSTIRAPSFPTEPTLWW